MLENTYKIKATNSELQQEDQEDAGGLIFQYLNTQKLLMVYLQ